jgi:hypothetical protein
MDVRTNVFGRDLLTPSMLISVAILEADRDRHGKKWCEKKGIGAVRRSLGATRPENVEDIGMHRTAELKEYAAARHSAVTLVIALCKACKGCPLGQE